MARPGHRDTRRFSVHNVGALNMSAHYFSATCGRPLHKKRKCRANAASLIVLINEQAPDLTSHRGSMDMGMGCRITGYELRVYLSPAKAPHSSRLSLCSCMCRRHTRPLWQPLSTRLKVGPLFIRFCRVLNFLNLHFSLHTTSHSLSVAIQHSPYHSSVPAHLSSFFIIYFSDFSINLMRQFGACCIRSGCVPLAGARTHCGCN